MAGKRKKKISLTEFRAWLEGVEELQPEEWHPDSDQWKLIRQKIDNIVEEKKTVERVVEQHPRYSPEPPRAPTPAPVSLPPSSFGPPDGGQFQPPPVEMTEAAKAALNGGVPKGMVPDADGKLKTPNIDTTDGDYNSGFA